MSETTTLDDAGFDDESDSYDPDESYNGPRCEECRSELELQDITDDGEELWRCGMCGAPVIL